MQQDPIAQLQDGWNAELPDLDTRAMATVARLNRCRALLFRRIEEHMTSSDSSLAEFDVLSTLRRQGPPYRMKPSTIARLTMLSPSGMTHRVDQLESANLLERVSDPNSRRTAPVALTKQGLQASERLVRTLVVVEEQALQSLTKAERTELDRLLAKLLQGLSNEET